jgi:hypothetical protein
VFAGVVSEMVVVGSRMDPDDAVSIVALSDVVAAKRRHIDTTKAILCVGVGVGAGMEADVEVDRELAIYKLECRSKTRSFYPSLRDESYLESKQQQEEMTAATTAATTAVAVVLHLHGRSKLL